MRSVRRASGLVQTAWCRPMPKPWARQRMNSSCRTRRCPGLQIRSKERAALNRKTRSTSGRIPSSWRQQRIPLVRGKYLARWRCRGFSAATFRYGSAFRPMLHCALRAPKQVCQASLTPEFRNYLPGIRGKGITCRVGKPHRNSRWLSTGKNTRRTSARVKAVR
jgi:hypothetical protein